MGHLASVSPTRRSGGTMRRVSSPTVVHPLHSADTPANKGNSCQAFVQWAHVRATRKHVSSAGRCCESKSCKLDRVLECNPSRFYCRRDNLACNLQSPPAVLESVSPSFFFLPLFLCLSLLSFFFLLSSGPTIAVS